MAQPPTWALTVANSLAYFHLRPWQPRLALDGRTEPLDKRIARLSARWRRSRFADAGGIVDHVENLLIATIQQLEFRRIPSKPIATAMIELGVELAIQNEIIFDFPEVDLTRSMTAFEAEHITDRLIDIEIRLENEARIFELFTIGLARLFIGLITEVLPDRAFDATPAALTVPLHAGTADVVTLVGRLGLTFIQDLVPDHPDAIAALVFRNTRNQLWQNILDVSKITIEQAEEAPDRIVGPKDCGLDPDAMIAAYLSGTHLQAFCEIPIPFALPDHVRPEHTLVVAASGTGKTQLIQHDIFTQLERPDPPGMVVIDSQGQMLAKIERLACFHPETGRLKDRLIIIDPADDASPALNMFVVPGRVHGYDRNIQETIESNTLQLFNFIFAALSQELTGRQSTAFSFVTRLMLSVPGATLRTLRQLLEDNAKTMERSPFAEHISKLDDDAQAFFKNQFFESAYYATKNQIVQRLYGVLRVPAFNRMFGSSENRLDLFQALQDGKIVLFNTSKALLGDDASSLFGRYAIALAIRAAFERVAVPEPHRLALLYIDEAKEYFKDATLDSLLTQVRKYNMGALIAFQNLDQLPPALRPVVLANTSIKVVAGVTEHDARLLARDMRTTPEALLALRKHARASEFACFIRNETPNAVRLTIPFGAIEEAPAMDAAANKRLRENNRRRVAVALIAPPVAARTTPPPLPPTQPAAQPKPATVDHGAPASEW